MNKYTVFLSEPAEQDISDIVFYISTQLLAPETADDMLDTFYNAMSSLVTMPKRHPLVDDVILANLGYRILPVKNYLVFYSVNDDCQEVNIERILYGKRDWQTLLNPKG